MKYTISLFLLLALTWWVLSGHASPLLLALGLGSVLLVLWLSRRMLLVDRESHPLDLSGGLLRFWAWLSWEVVVANLQVVRLVLSPRPALDPSVLRVGIRQRSDLGRVILANSITLTPGTVTLDVGEDWVLVHALTRASAADVAAGTIDRRIPCDVEAEAPVAGA